MVMLNIPMVITSLYTARRPSLVAIALGVAVVLTPTLPTALLSPPTIVLATNAPFSLEHCLGSLVRRRCLGLRRVSSSEVRNKICVEITSVNVMNGWLQVRAEFYWSDTSITCARALTASSSGLNIFSRSSSVIP